MASAKPAFRLTNATFPLFVVHLLTDDIDRFKAQVASQVAEAPELFLGTPVVLSLAAVAEADAEVDWEELLAFFHEQGMRVAGVMDASPAQREAAMAAGWGVLPDRATRKAAPAEAPAEARAVASDPAPAEAAPLAQGELPLATVEVATAVAAEVATQAAAEVANAATAAIAAAAAKVGAGETAFPAAPTAASQRPALVIDKPVRTGQRIHAEGCDLIVLAVVSAGAELIADGNIHVYAPLRGRALAGARGNVAARIFAQSMEAELVSIAGNFKVLDEGVPGELKGRSVQVFLEQDRVVLAPLGGSAGAAEKVRQGRFLFF